MWNSYRKEAEFYGFTVTMPNDNKLVEEGEKVTQSEMSSRIFKNCVWGITGVDGILVNLETYRGSEPDGGSIYELGMAYAVGARCYGYTRDKRTVGVKYQAARYTPDAKGAKDVNDGASRLADGASQVDTGLGEVNKALSGQLIPGAQQLATGSDQLYTGVTKLQGGSKTLANGVNKLSDGSMELYKGTVKFSGGQAQFARGMGQLAKGTKALDSAVDSAMDKVKGELRKLDDSNMLSVIDNAKSVNRAAKSYKSFEGKGSYEQVSFIYKIDGVSTK